MSLPKNIQIKELNTEKALVYQGIAFLGRIEKFPVFSKTHFFAETPCTQNIAYCDDAESAIKFLISRNS